MQTMAMSVRSAARWRGRRYVKMISTYTCPFSRTSQGAPRQGTISRAYSVKVKKCAEL